jgi:hypothetical protein
MKKIITVAFAVIALSAHAEEDVSTAGSQQPTSTIEIPQWIKNINFSGYGMVQYIGTDQKDAKTNTFNLRYARFIMEGKISDFDWRVQIQGSNVKGPGEPTVQLLDLYAEWRKYQEVKIRVGEFKRAFTFDNPSHPVTQGWRGYADAVKNLAGLGDRTGEKSSGGRDIGIQIQGDLFPNANGRRLFHYQIGVYNGEGINSKDCDNRKDIIGGFWVMPIKGMRIGAFGWTGSHGGMTTVNGTDESVSLNRYCLSAEYDLNEYTIRAEYIHSQGWGSGVVGNTTINYALGDKADGWYVFGIVPIVKSKLHAKARYQSYRVSKEWGSSVNQVECGLNYYFSKNLELHLEYSRVNDRTLAKHNYNLIDAEFDFRF